MPTRTSGPARPALRAAKPKQSRSTAKTPKPKARKPAMLPMSEGNAGVKAYIASMEPWQAAIAKRMDALVVKHVRGVRKAVKWHSPMYGVEEQGFFLAFAAFQHHINFMFFRGASLKPVPPDGGQKHARSLRVHESDKLDEKQMVAWIKQAAAIPGWVPGKRL